MEKGMLKKPQATADLWMLWSMFGASEAIMGPHHHNFIGMLRLKLEFK